MKSITLDIVKSGINGEGIGYENRKPVFVTGAFPKEKVQLTLELETPKYAKGTTTQVLVAHPHRIDSACPVAHRCGGCPLMEADASLQKELKEEILREALMKYAHEKGERIKPLQAAPNQSQYRNQCKLPVTQQKGKLSMGLYAANSNVVIDTPRCLCHEPVLDDCKNEILNLAEAHDLSAYQEKTRTGLRSLVIRTFAGKTQVTLVTGKDSLPQAFIDQVANLPTVCSVYQNRNTLTDTHALFSKDFTLLAKEKTLDFDFMGLSLSLYPDSFFQLNTAQAQKLYTDTVAEVKDPGLVVEAYCGIGVMSLLVAKKGYRVIGIESVDHAVKNATACAERNGITKVSFVCQDAAKGLQAIQEPISTLIVDPPRSGLDEAMLTTILEKKPNRILYVSCNPASLGKNLRVLKQDYEMRQATPYDLFPNTPLVECLVVLQKRKGH